MGCSLNINDLPFREYPFISELEFLKDFNFQGEKVLKTRFKDNKIKIPFIIFFKLNEVEGNGSLKIMIYNENKIKIYEKIFNFGEVDKYYEYIILYNRITNLAGKKFYYTIFYNKDLILADWIKIEKSPIPDLASEEHP